MSRRLSQQIVEERGSKSGLGAQVLPLTPFGKYTLVARVGMGGMAEVFLAAFAGPGRFRKLLVIKRLHPHLTDEDGFLEMFLDEARLAARLHHPNVVQTYEVGDAEGQPFLAMEHLDGQPVNRVMRKCGERGHGLPVRLAVRIVTDALDGLHYAHELRDYDGTPLNVVHRDVSPVNIFVTYGGEVKLLDFGIAKAATQFQHTRTGQLKGKFAYMAPEHARDEGIDRRSDIFSMGVVLWELLTGRRLFKGENELATYHNVVTADIPSPADFSPSVSDDLAEIALRALSRDRAHRYQSALEMKRALEKVSALERLEASRGELSKFTTEIFAAERVADAKIYERCMNDDMPVHEATTTGEAAARAELDSRAGAARAARRALLSSSSSQPGTVMSTPRRSDQIALNAEEHSPPGWDAATHSHFRQAPDARDRESKRRTARVIALSAIAIVFGASMTLLVRGGDAVPAPSAPPPAHYGPIVPAPMHAETHAEPVMPAAQVAIPVTVSAPTAVEDIAAPAPVEERSEPTRRERNRRRRVAAAQHAERAREPAEETAPEAIEEQGFLTLDTTPWSTVTLNGRSLGATPLIRVRLPAGEHVLTLSNPEQHMRTTYRVRIEPGSTTARRVGLE